MREHNIIRNAASIGTVAVILAGANAYGQSQDGLLDKLVSKGILTQDEAQDLRDEADEGFRRAFQAKTGMPDWVTSLKFAGDLRGRYEGFYTGQAATRNRYRYRLRYGVTAALADSIEVGFRLGSGDATATGGFIDPISTNQTLDNNGAKKGIFIDMAYAKWTPINTATWQAGLVAGKMENPFVTSDQVFDGDYTPEGIAFNAKYSFNDKHSLKGTAGAFVVDEVGASSRDPYMIAAQLRFDSAWDEKQIWQSSFGVGIFSLVHDENLGNAAVPNINVGNTRNPAGGSSLTEGLNPIVVDGAVTRTLETFPFYTGKFPIKLAGDFMHNPAAEADNEGYSFGVTFGKSGKRKTWELTYRWKELQSDAWYEELVDSDAGAFYSTAFTNSGLGTGYRAGTNVRGHYIKGVYSPYDSFSLGVTYFGMEAIKENPAFSGSNIARLQVDAILKF